MQKQQKQMHIKRCMMHKCMAMKHLMHEESYKDRKNQIKDQKRISSIIGTLPHPNGMIVWNEYFIKSETRVGRIRNGDAHKQGGKSINHILQQLTIFNQIRFSLHNTTSKKFKFLFSFDSFKSLKLGAMRSKMTKDTTMVTNNEFRSTRFIREGSSTMILFFLQHGTLRSFMTDHITIVASRNKLRSTQLPRMGPKQRLRFKCLSLNFLISFVWRNVYRFVL